MAGVPLRVVIADDERPARRFLANVLRSLSDVELVGEAANGTEAVRVIATTQPDVVLLDRQMPELDGRAVVQELHAPHTPFVVFVTAHQERATEPAGTDAIPWLLKPVDANQLQHALAQARTWLSRRPGHVKSPVMTR